MRTVLVKGLADRKITEIACGQQHAIAMDEDGYAPYHPSFSTLS